MSSVKPFGFIKPAMIFNLMILFITGATLSISDLFIYASLTPFLLFIQAVSLLILFSGIVLFAKPGMEPFVNYTLISVALFGAYIFANGSIINQAFNSTILTFCSAAVCLLACHS